MKDPQLESAIDTAKRLGTYGKLDRSKQYEGRYSPELLLRNDNEVFRQLREDREDRFRHRLITMGLSALLAWAPKIVVFLLKFF
jgi:hypothetical protein